MLQIMRYKIFSRCLYSLLLCLCLPFFTSCASQRTIVNGLDEREANEILVLLSSRGIDAAKVHSLEGGGPGGAGKSALWDIKVNETQAIEAMALLSQMGLPRRKGQNLLNIFANSGLVPSELQEKIRYQSGLAEQIANTIRKIDGVLDAEVQISFPEENPLNPLAEKKEKMTASVYVKHTGVLDDPNAHLINKIKRLVAASVPGLDYDNVTVIGDRARNISVFEEGNAASKEAKQYVSIWTITLAVDSVSRFRIIFFSLILTVLLLALSLIWIGWKLFPLLGKYGGIKQLFHLHPITEEAEEKGDELEKEQEKEEPEGKDGGVT